MKVLKILENDEEEEEKEIETSEENILEKSTDALVVRKVHGVVNTFVD